MARLYLDQDALGLAPYLRSAHHNVTTAFELYLSTAFDEIHLLTATRLGAVLITHNWRDFYMLHRAWQLWSQEWGSTAEHSGILCVPQKLEVDILARELVAFLASGHRVGNHLHRWQQNAGWEHYPPHPVSQGAD